MRPMIGCNDEEEKMQIVREYYNQIELTTCQDNLNFSIRNLETGMEYAING